MIFLSFIISCKNQDTQSALNCEEYWSQIPFSDFCGLSSGDFDFNDIPNDICNADQNNTFPFDDRISIRVFNHFSDTNAREEYVDEEEAARSTTGYTSISNLGDDAFAILTSEFGELDLAIFQIVKNTYSVYLELNGSASNGANNCFDESSVVEFARALVNPL